jgi:hypothetical protein
VGSHGRRGQAIVDARLEEERHAKERALEERSVKELREWARELQLPGRSSMRKDELIAALRKQPK